MLHEAYHVVVLVVLLVAIALGFLGIAGPHLFGAPLSGRQQIWLVAALLAAGGGFGLDWLAHRLGWF